MSLFISVPVTVGAWKRVDGSLDAHASRTRNSAKRSRLIFKKMNTNKSRTAQCSPVTIRSDFSKILS